MKLSEFKHNLTHYSGYYSPAALFEKIGRVARKAGIKTVHGVLILYYATFDTKLPVKDRLLVLAALGYFILPADLLPDALPGGFADDAAALGYVIKHIWNNLSDETFSRARQKLIDWFGEEAAGSSQLSPVTEAKGKDDERQ